MARARLVVLAAVLAALGAGGLRLRRALIRAVVTAPAPPGEAPRLAGGDGPGLGPAARVRVVVVDGASAAIARAMPAWSALCARGVDATVDVGFPTVSLPVEAVLWGGLTQQQTGLVFHAEGPLTPPLDGLPARVPGSWAVAESHPEIIGSLGFARAEPGLPAPAGWATTWPDRARAAVASDARLAFVHLLGVDVAGHRAGAASAAYRSAATTADATLAALVALAPDARWLVLADHGHLPGGGHGGEERAIRQVRACLAGPGLAPARVGPLPLVDLSRALADSLGLTPAARAVGRPWAVAVAHPLRGDEAVPALPAGPLALAAGVLALALALTAWAAGRRLAWWPWWLGLALAGLVAVRGLPTLSTPMIYAPAGRAMYLTWLPALAAAAAGGWAARARARALVGLLALPLGLAAAALTASGAWPAALGAAQAPVWPCVTAWMSPLVLLAAQGLWAAALAALATAARPRSGPP